MRSTASSGASCAGRELAAAGGSHCLRACGRFAMCDGKPKRYGGRLPMTMANQGNRGRQTQAYIGRKLPCLPFAIFSIEVLKKRRKKKKTSVYVPVCTCAREAMYVAPVSLKTGLPIPWRLLTICPRSLMWLQGMACAKPCYRIGELLIAYTIGADFP